MFFRNVRLSPNYTALQTRSGNLHSYRQENFAKFLGLQIDNHSNWENHIDQFVPELSGACYAVRSMSHISNTDILKSIYFAYFHSLMKYGIILGGNLSDSKKIFTLQKKIVRITVGVKPRNSFRALFKRSQFLLLPCEYVFSLINFIINNQELFRPIQLYTELTQETSTTFIDQLLSCHVFREAHIMLS
jgi:hypothetical protein